MGQTTKLNWFNGFLPSTLNYRLLASSTSSQATVSWGKGPIDESRWCSRCFQRLRQSRSANVSKTRSKSPDGSVVFFFSDPNDKPTGQWVSIYFHPSNFSKWVWKSFTYLSTCGLFRRRFGCSNFPQMIDLMRHSCDQIWMQTYMGHQPNRLHEKMPSQKTSSNMF